METTKLINLLAKSLNYTPIVYKQSSYKTEKEGTVKEFIVEHQFTEIQNDSLFFFIPVTHSINGSNILNIRTPYVSGDEPKYRYKDNKLKLYVETNEGTIRALEESDIIPFRMCIIRFRKNGDELIAIVCNSPLYNEASYSKLVVTDCSFINMPIVTDPTTQEEYRLVSIKELNELEKRLEVLEKRIIFGTVDPETALTNSDVGTIYIQYEED